MSTRKPGNSATPHGYALKLETFPRHGYDSEAKAYWNFDMDSTGLSSLGKVVIQESTWTHVWDYQIGGKSLKMRLALSDVIPSACVWKNGYSMAAGPWTLFAEGKAIKLK